MSLPAAGRPRATSRAGSGAGVAGRATTGAGAGVEVIGGVVGRTTTIVRVPDEQPARTSTARDASFGTRMDSLRMVAAALRRQDRPWLAGFPRRGVRTMSG